MRSGFLQLAILVAFLVSVKTGYADDRDVWSVFIQPDSLLSPQITCLERSGSTIYVGTSKGLNLIDDGKISKYGPFVGLPYEKVVDIAFDVSGRIWCIVEGRVYVLTQGYFHRCILEGLDTLKGGRATALEMGIRDIMICTNRGSIFAVNAKESLRLDTMEVSPMDSVLIQGDTLKRDSLLRSGITLRASELTYLRSGAEIRDIKHSSRGIYYLVATDGFWRFNSEKREIKKVGREIFYDSPGIYVDTEGDSAVWLVSSDLIGRLRLRTPATLIDTVRISSVKVIAIDDSLGFGWCIAANALYEFYPDTLAFVRHVLPDTMKEYRLTSVLVLSDGKVLLGSNKGLLKFQPGGPNINITSINVLKERDKSDNVLMELGIQNAQAYPYIECIWSIEGTDMSGSVNLEPKGQDTLNIGNLKPNTNYTIRVRIKRPLNGDQYVEKDSPFDVPDRRDHKVNWLKIIGIIAAIAIVLILGIVLFFGIRRNRKIKKLKAKKAQLAANPYIVGGVIMESEKFIGRHQILKEILAGIINNSFLVHGKKRIGKTSLLYQIRNQINSQDWGDYELIPIMITLEKFTGRSSKSFYTKLTHDMAQAVLSHTSYSRITKRQYDYNDFELFMEKLLRTLRRKNPAKKVKVVLLIDEGDRMSNYGPNFHSQFRGVFQSSYAENVHLVLALRDFTPEWREYTSPWFNFFVIKQLGPMTRKETEELIQTYVRGAIVYPKRVLREIWKITEGYPYEVQGLCFNIFDCLGAAVFVSLSHVKQARKKIIQEKTNGHKDGA